MADRSYNIDATVTGADEVKDLATSMDTLATSAGKIPDETIEVKVESEGVTETAEGLDSIAENTGAAGNLGDIGDAAGDAAPKADGAAGAFQSMLGAISLVEVASFGVDTIMGRIADSAARAKAQNAFDASQVEEFAAALAAAADDANVLLGHLSGAGEIITTIGGEERDLVPALAAAGITAQEFTGYVEGGAEGLQALKDRLWETSGGFENYTDIVLGAAQLQNNLTTAVEANTAVNAVYGDSLPTAELEAAAAGAKSYAEAIGSIDYRNADTAGATTAMAGFTAQLFAAENQVQAQETAFAALASAADGVALTFDVATESGRAQQDALEGVAAVVDGRLVQAYAAADGSQEQFIASATEIADQTLGRLQTELGLSTEQVDALREMMGLTPEQLAIRAELSGAAEAQLQLGLLQGAITGLPPDVELRVNALIVQGDYVGARDEVANYYAGNPVEAPVTPDTTGFVEGVQSAFFGIPPAVIDTEADTAPAEEQIAATTDEPRTATIDAEADTIAAASDLLDTADEPRTALIVAHARVAGAAIDLDQVAERRDAAINAVALTGLAESELDGVAKPRTARVTADASTGGAEAELNRVARNRTATITVRTVGGGGFGGGGGPFGAFATAPTPGGTPVGARGFGAAAPRGAHLPSNDTGGGSTLVIERIVEQSAPSVTINAAVIGNRFDVERAVTKALNGHRRLNGTRRS